MPTNNRKHYELYPEEKTFCELVTWKDQIDLNLFVCAEFTALDRNKYYESIPQRQERIEAYVVWLWPDRYWYSLSSLEKLLENRLADYTQLLAIPNYSEHSQRIR